MNETNKLIDRVIRSDTVKHKISNRQKNEFIIEFYWILKSKLNRYPP